MIDLQEARALAEDWLRRHRKEQAFLRVSAEVSATPRSWLFYTVDKNGKLVAGGFTIIVDKRYGAVRECAGAWREFVPDPGLKLRVERRLIRWLHSY